MSPTTRLTVAAAGIRRAFLAGPALLAACTSLGINDPNNPALEELRDRPTPSGVITATSGLLIGARANIAAQNGYVVLLGILGREGYNFDAADPRFVTEMLIGPLDGGSPAFGGNLWAARYANIRNANIVLAATEKVAGLSEAALEGIRGFAKTMQALDYLLIINTRDASGAAIDVDGDPTAAPAPIATKAEVFARIIALLGEAQAHLAAAGPAFAFPLSSGFEGFNTPATFLTFNRAIRARVAIYQNDWAGALTALGQSFMDAGAALTLGAYHAYSTGSGDQTNTLFDPLGRALYGHPSLLQNAQLRANNTPDLRTAKVAVGDPLTVQGVTSNLLWTRYPSNAASVPIIRNEELILLRAEANIGLNNLGPAVSDLNLIRTQAGGLPNYSGPMTQSALRDELLYNKRYSLLWEGGHVWLDLRRYGLLNRLPRDLGTHRVFAKMPFPINECLPRTPQPAGCGTEAGIP